MGRTAKTHLNKFRVRSEPLFDDLGRGDYFLPSFLQIERLLDVDDVDVSIQKVDYVNGTPNGVGDDCLLGVAVGEKSNDFLEVSSPFSTCTDNVEPVEASNCLSPVEPLDPLFKTKEEMALDDFYFSLDDTAVFSPTKGVVDDLLAPAIADIDTRRYHRSRITRSSPLPSTIPTRANKGKERTYNPLVLHGETCWVTVKWEGLPYSDATFEELNDIRAAGIDYETQMRAFYKREQRAPVIPSKQKRVKRTLDSSLIEGDSPSFPAGALRDYQWEGVRWLLFNWSQRRNSILADEMGLGKTIQTAGFLQLLKRFQGLTGPFLVVAPLSTIVNWQRELDAWTDMDSIIYHGSQEDRQLIREHEFYYMSRNKKEGYKLEIVITTPETCMASDCTSTNGRMSRELSQIDWDLLVVDEAHKLKNHSSKLCTTIREDFSYQNCLLLTGTPLQNNTDELWTLLNVIDKDKFDNKVKFSTEFGELKDTAQLQSLHQLLKPYLLRREKENVEKSVPPKEEVIIEVELTIPQKQYYRAIYEQNTSFLYRGGIKDGPSLSNLAMELRKCCNHPFLVKGAEAELIKSAAQDENINNSDTGYVDTLVMSSGKMVLLDKLLPKLRSQGHRVLIFSQFRIMLDIIEDYLLLRQFSYDRVDGAVTGKKRQSVIDKYSAPDSNVFVMLLSTKAGGVGINLTSADTVIIFDSDWNPQNDLQAQARAHRIG